MISVPRRRTTPESGCSKPAAMRRAVVFPQPLGPSSVTNSPEAMSKLNWESATVLPNDLRSAESCSATESVFMSSISLDSDCRNDGTLFTGKSIHYTQQCCTDHKQQQSNGECSLGVVSLRLGHVGRQCELEQQ